jgi:PAS domain S-box-containing protein
VKGRILVVEDNLITSQVITHQIRKLGYGVAGVLKTGQAAVDWLLSHDADLVLMDVQLEGEMDGVQAATIIRERSEIPIVYLTGNSDVDTISRASETRASGYLPKPLDEQALHSTIVMALGRHSVDARAAEDRDRLARTIAALPAAIIAVDATGCITSMNAAAEDFTGCPSSAAVGEDISKVLRALDAQGNNVAGDVPSLFLDAALSPIRQTVTVISANGGRRLLEQVASPILDDTGRLTGVVLAFQEVPAQPPVTTVS